jgi:nitroreductase
MVRSFSSEPITADIVEGLLDAARRGPSAGNARGTAWIVLHGPEQTERYWMNATTATWRSSSGRWPGLSRAPVILVALASPAAYVARYSQPDKAASGLGDAASGGGGEGAWTVPYWFADAAAATMLVLLTAVDLGLGAAFLGNFRNERAVLGALDVPAGWRLFGATALGRPDGADHPSPSLRQPAPQTPRVHYGSWEGTS